MIAYATRLFSAVLPCVAPFRDHMDLHWIFNLTQRNTQETPGILILEEAAGTSMSNTKGRDFERKIDGHPP
jgi:hypothetical protein